MAAFLTRNYGTEDDLPKNFPNLGKFVCSIERLRG
ncbi:hypothetical protein CCACVL1_29134 [Corchorus capsularis]|uniref:Uncharacterized protein n=1 Tax=Corchorus capsularis TaxID=210143 RepID=A0A1R3G3K8_COCAP|nr:hypothetical protein CCACVL1_29134 [Corchorus capsularis]